MSASSHSYLLLFLHVSLLTRKSPLYTQVYKGRMSRGTTFSYRNTITLLHLFFCNGKSRNCLHTLASAAQFKSYLPHLFSEITFQPTSDSLLRYVMCTPLFHNFFLICSFQKHSFCYKHSVNYLIGGELVCQDEFPDSSILQVISSSIFPAYTVPHRQLL